MQFLLIILNWCRVNVPKPFSSSAHFIKWAGFWLCAIKVFEIPEELVFKSYIAWITQEYENQSISSSICLPYK